MPHSIRLLPVQSRFFSPRAARLMVSGVLRAPSRKRPAEASLGPPLLRDILSVCQAPQNPLHPRQLTVISPRRVRAPRSGRVLPDDQRSLRQVILVRRPDGELSHPHPRPTANLKTETLVHLPVVPLRGRGTVQGCQVGGGERYRDGIFTRAIRGIAWQVDDAHSGQHGLDSSPRPLSAAHCPPDSGSQARLAGGLILLHVGAARVAWAIRADFPRRLLVRYRRVRRRGALWRSRGGERRLGAGRLRVRRQSGKQRVPSLRA